MTKHVLLIDDEISFLRNLKDFLEDFDCTVHTAINGNEGLSCIIEQNPDIVIVDLRMPVMDGYEFTRQAKKIYPNLPIIVLSGVGQIDDAMRAVREGAWDFISKPLPDMQPVLHTIDKCIEKAHLIESNEKHQQHLEELVKERTLELKEKNNDLMVEIKVREGTEERLQQANAELDATLRAIPDLMFEMDGNGKYIDLWAQDTDLLVAKKEALIDHNVNEMLPSDAAFEVMAAIREAAETGTSQGQIVRLPLEHCEHWFELSTSKKQHTDSYSHFLMLYRDITDKHQMEEELFKARKLESVGVLAGGIAHDFNNILFGIMGNIELASYCVEKDSRGAEALLSEAQKAAKRAAKLTQQLLTFSKGGDPVKEKTSLARLIQDSADFVLHGSRVFCDYTFPDDLWTVNADSGQISQVIQNLILNAKFAMPDGGSINVSCNNVEDAACEQLLSRHEGNFISITIEDTGVGIPQEIINKIFDPYFTTKPGGSGLGLSICHAIIDKHDGNIMVQSNIGKGTTFTVYLPAEPSTDVSVTKQQKPKTAVKAARVMVMDDEQMVRNLTQSQLSTLGHEAILVEDGEEAINTYQELQDTNTPVDLVIMDLTIPGGMGGQEAARKLLQLAPEAKIIVASGYSNDPVMANYREYGFCAAVAKPFDLAELSEGIDSVLS